MINSVPLRKLTMLLLLNAGFEPRRNPSAIEGVTRLQKYVFLVQERSGLQPDTFNRRTLQLKSDFKYEPEQFGPADLQLYADVDFLQIAGLIHITGEEHPGHASVTGAMPAAASDVLPYESEDRGSVLDAQPGPSTTSPFEQVPLLPDEAFEVDLKYEYLVGMRSNEEELSSVPDDMVQLFTITKSGQERLKRVRSALSGNDTGFADRISSECGSIRDTFDSYTLRNLLAYVYKEYPSWTEKSSIRDQILGRTP